MRNFAAGIRKDLAAVRAGLTEGWSNGPVEGFVNKLKPLNARATDGPASSCSGRGCWPPEDSLRAVRKESHRFTKMPTEPRVHGEVCIEICRWLGDNFRPDPWAGKLSPLLCYPGCYSGTSAPNQTSRNSSQATQQSVTTDMVLRMRCTVSYNSWRCAPGPGYSSGRYRWKSA